MPQIQSTSGAIGLHSAATGIDKKLMKVANQLESSFIAEMLKSAGVGEARSEYGGGAGEEQFSSFLVQEYADATVKAGGIGLSEAIYRSLVERQGG